MKRVSKKEMDEMQAMIDSMSGKKMPMRAEDSNTEAESKAGQFMDAWAMAEDETQRKKKMRKMLGGM